MLEGEEIMLVSPQGVNSITFEEAARRFAQILGISLPTQPNPDPQPDPEPEQPPTTEPPKVTPPTTGEWVKDGDPVPIDKTAEKPPVTDQPAPPVLGDRWPGGNLNETDDEGTPVTYNESN